MKKDYTTSKGIPFSLEFLAEGRVEISIIGTTTIAKDGLVATPENPRTPCLAFNDDKGKKGAIINEAALADYKAHVAAAAAKRAEEASHLHSVFVHGWESHTVVIDDRDVEGSAAKLAARYAADGITAEMVIAAYNSKIGQAASPSVAPLPEIEHERYFGSPAKAARLAKKMPAGHASGEVCPRCGGYCYGACGA